MREGEGKESEGRGVGKVDDFKGLSNLLSQLLSKQDNSLNSGNEFSFTTYC